MINKIVEALDPVVVGTILGIMLLFPFSFFIYDSSKNPDKYRHK
jgi:ABC-type phosphate/phosphonate transport system permease subunit